MLEKPKHFPVYVASYTKEGKILNNSIIAKISKSKDINSTVDTWGEVKITSINLTSLNDEREERHLLDYNQSDNTYNRSDAILIPKDIWIKYVKKANKLIDERNKKEGSSIKRISY